VIPGCRFLRRGHWQVAIAALLAGAAANAPAADLYWSGTGTWDTTTANWGTATTGPYDAAIWSNDPPDAAIFEGTAGTVALGEAITAAGLTFGTTGYTVTGGTLTLSGTPAISTGTDVSATIASILAGSDAITKTGAGTLTLSGANTHTGGTTVSQGVIVVGNAAAFGTAAITLSGGSLRPTANVTIANGIVAVTSTTSDLINGGSGDFVYTGSGSGSGTLVANSTVGRSMWLQGDWSGFSGELQFTMHNNGTNYRLGGTELGPSDTTTAADFSGASFLLGGATVANRQLSWNGLQGATVRIGALSGSGGRIDAAFGSNRAATWEIGALNTNTSFSGVFAGTGTAVTKVGTGTLTLSGANTHTGGTRLEAGILATGNNDAFGTGTLTLAGGTVRPTTNRVIGNAISVATGTTSGLIDGGSGDLMYTGAATGNGNLAANSTTSRSMWLQGDWSGFTGQITFTVNGGGTNYRLGGTPGATLSNNGTNGSDFSQATFVLSGAGTDRGLSWNGAQGATVKVGTLAGTGGRIISGTGTRDANWEVGGLNADSSAAVVITGNATSLTKVGTGTLTLQASSTYAGGTTVNAGTLNLDAASAIGAGSLTIAAGASVAALKAFAISIDNSSSNSRVVNVAGELSMVDSEYVKTYNLTGGSIAAPPSGAGYLRAAASGLFINSLPAATSSQITGRIDLTFASGTLDVADGAAADDLVISAAILQNSGAGSGAKSITKTGAGTLLLSGTNSYAGGTFIDAGLVKAGSSRALGAENAAASTVTIAAGATLDINRVTGNTGDFFYGMTIAGAGTAGQGALINTGANGNTNLRQTPNITLSADATIGGSGNILMINTGFGANSLDLAGNTLTKTGSNTFFLCNTTVTAGTIDIQQGTLSHFLNAANASAAAIRLADAAGATLALNTLGLEVGSLAGGGATGGSVTLGPATLTLGGRNEDASFGGSISGTGAVVKTGTGTQTFAAANTYSGGTTISGGTLVAGNANAFGTSGAISVGDSGTLGVGDGVTFTRPFTLTAGGRLRTGNGSTVGLPSVAALAAWESQSGTGDETLAEILDASGSTTPTALFSAWTANPGTYFSDILTLEGSGAGNTYVLSMGYNEFASGNLNIWYRENVADAFVPLGTSFAGNVPWTSAFTTPGQYGVDTSAGTVWVVTDHNSQFVIVPEPGTLGLAAVGLAGGIWYLRRRRAVRRP